MADRKKLLAALTEPDDKAVAARVLDLQSEALASGDARVTDFLDPREQTLAALVMQQEPSLRYELQGGYPQAERRRMVLIPPGNKGGDFEAGLAMVEVSGAFKFEKPGHRDYLGAVMGLGIKREKIGDILILDTGAQIIVTEELVPVLELQLTGVGNQSVTAAERPLEALTVPEERVKELRFTVASLRLDSVAAGGFGASRSQMARDIKSARVRLNWRPVYDPSETVKLGDTISIRGRGRVVVENITGETKKGRIGLAVKRYI